jgi:predicted DNA binding CopG/RHH family protein
MANDDNVSSISKSRSIAEMAEFWDTHDATDFEGQTQPVEFEFDLRSRRHYIAIDPDLLARLRDVAAARGLSAESLANLWLQERVLKQPA